MAYDEKWEGTHLLVLCPLLTKIESLETNSQQDTIWFIWLTCDVQNLVKS